LTIAAGGTATFIDAEHALDPHYAARLGVNTEQLLVSQPDSGEQALEIADTLVKVPLPPVMNHTSSLTHLFRLCTRTRTYAH
jgi:hypothetical protein